MTTATRYDAIDFFDQVFNNVLRQRGNEASCKTPTAAYTPPQEVRLIRVDVAETAGSYLVTAELPGVRKDDIQIDIEGKLLVLNAQTYVPAIAVASAEAATAETKVETKPEAKRLLLSERFEGKLTRRLQLPSEIDASAVEAKFQDGVLELVLPKQKPRGGLRIEIK